MGEPSVGAILRMGHVESFDLAHRFCGDFVGRRGGLECSECGCAAFVVKDRIFMRFEESN